MLVNGLGRKPALQILADHAAKSAGQKARGFGQRQGTCNLAGMLFHQFCYLLHDNCIKACNNSKYFLDYSDFCLKGMNPSYQEAPNTDPMYSEEEDDTNKTNE